MKIGILTFSNGYNYGAILQCYALQQYLRNNNVDAEVVNFKKEKQYGSCNLLSPAYVLRKFYSFMYKIDIKKKRQKFDDFFNENINFSPTKEINEENISDYVKKYDILIFGSDQIWNMSEKIYDRSNVYFGDFDFCGKKVSYAASFGESIEIAQNNINFIKDKLEQFSAISVREKSGCDFLSNNNIKNTFVVDPTLLLTKTEWELLCRSSKSKKIPSKYILYYSVNCRKYSWSVAKKLSKLTGLKVINLEEHPKILGAGFINDYCEGPNEFLELIKNAEYIVTNSFHGTVFSILFQKKLVPVFDTNEGEVIKEERKYSLLEMAGLLDIVTTNDNFKDVKVYNNINYKEVEKNIGHLVNKSKKFLNENCGGLDD